MGAPTQCRKCFRAMVGSLGRHAGSRRCAFYEAAHQAVDAGSNPPAGLVAADPDAAPPQPPRRASNWDAGIPWLGTLAPSDHLQAPGGRMTLDDFTSKPSVALFGDCVGLTLALRKDHPTKADVLLLLLPRILLGPTAGATRRSARTTASSSTRWRSTPWAVRTGPPRVSSVTSSPTGTRQRIQAAGRRTRSFESLPTACTVHRRHACSARAACTHTTAPGAALAAALRADS